MANNNFSIVQCNLDRSKSCQQEFIASFMAGRHKIALVSEPYVGSGREVQHIPGANVFQFCTGERVKACVVVKSDCGSALGMTQYSTCNLSVVRLDTGGRRIFIASAYVEPDHDTHNTLHHIDTFIKSARGGSIILGGDLNGWHPLWGSNSSNPRGDAVVELACANDLHICNTGTTPTFETVTHGCPRTSIIDITMASYDIFDAVREWRVDLTLCPNSQHNAIAFCVDAGTLTHSTTQHTTLSTFRYKSAKASWARFSDSLSTQFACSDVLERDIHSCDTQQLDNTITDTLNIIHTACSESMPTKNHGSKYKPPWWTEALEGKKRQIINLHRTLHTASRRGPPPDSLVCELRDFKAEYKTHQTKTSVNSVNSKPRRTCGRLRIAY